MATPQIDLTGTWRGHYEQSGGKHGISMVVAQRGGAIVGRMRDDDTVLVEGLRIAGGGRPGRAAEATAMTELPEHARIEGDVQGRTVVFAKHYEGAQRTTVWHGDQQLQLELPQHSVIYRGTLDADGEVLRGLWRIPPREPGAHLEQGAFELRRQRS